MSADTDTLLEFPCDFPIKVFGRDDAAFEQTVFDLIQAHVPRLQHSAIRRNTSRGGKYVALTVEIRAHGKAQLDAIYADLTACDAVVMAL